MNRYTVSTSMVRSSMPNFFGYTRTFAQKILPPRNSHDVLREEGLEYGRKLKLAGVNVKMFEFTGTHVFTIGLADLESPQFLDALFEINHS